MNQYSTVLRTLPWMELGHSIVGLLASWIVLNLPPRRARIRSSYSLSYIYIRDISQNGCITKLQ